MPNLIVCTRIYRWKEIYVKESEGSNSEKRNYSLIAFLYPMSWNIFKIRKGFASWLSAYHHGLQWEDAMGRDGLIQVKSVYDGCI